MPIVGTSNCALLSGFRMLFALDYSHKTQAKALFIILLFQKFTYYSQYQIWINCEVYAYVCICIFRKNAAHHTDDQTIRIERCATLRAWVCLCIRLHKMFNFVEANTASNANAEWITDQTSLTSNVRQLGRKEGLICSHFNFLYR